MKKLLHFFPVIFFSFLNVIQLNAQTNIDSTNNASVDTFKGKMAPAIITELVNRADSLQQLYNNTISAQSHGQQAKESLSDYVKSLSTSLAISILIFGFLLIIAILFFLYKQGKDFGNFAFQIVGLIIVVSAALFLIVTGYNQDQITPVIGLFGTIVGFIFGSNINPRADFKEKVKADNSANSNTDS